MLDTKEENGVVLFDTVGEISKVVLLGVIAVGRSAVVTSETCKV